MNSLQNLFLALNIHLRVYGNEVLFDSRDTDEERGGDLFIGISPENQAQNIYLAFGQHKIPADLGDCLVHHVGQVKKEAGVTFVLRPVLNAGFADFQKERAVLHLIFDIAAGNAADSVHLPA